MKNLNKKAIITIGTSILIALAVGGASALLTHGSMDEFNALHKPAFSPPGIAFPIVWTILYILMGIGVGIIYLSDNKYRTCALNLYVIQLAMNFLWTIIFFNLERRLFAFMWIMALLLIVILMFTAFYKIVPLAGYLQIPYILWLMFASYINLSIFLLNR